MRLVSYNVRYFGHRLKGLASTAHSKEAIATQLAALSPLADLVALQEVETRSMRASALHRGAHPRETQLEAFVRHLEEALRAHGSVMPYRAYYFPAHEYLLGSMKLYTTGLAILVNSKTVNVLTHNGDRPHSVTHHGTRRLKTLKQTRIAAHLHLEDVHGQTLHLFNTHLSLPTPFDRGFWSNPDKMGHGRNQLLEARALAGYAAHVSKREPSLVVGDFNTPPASPVYSYLTGEAGLVGAQAALGLIDAADPRGFPTAGFLRLRMHLDHVFASRDLAFTGMQGTHRFGDAAGPFHGLSDHVPLIVSFEAG